MKMTIFAGIVALITKNGKSLGKRNEGINSITTLIKSMLRA
jgi:hypothetical protein